MPAKPQRLSLAQAVGGATPRGAAALFADTSTPGTELEGARRLPMAVIEPNPQQARRAFDPGALQELADSIGHHGVLEPILVRPLEDRYQIIAGERRFRAAVLAGLTDIPAIIQDMDDTTAAYATAVENLQREDLDIEDEARQFALLLEVTGLSQRKLAEKLGISHDYLTRRIALLPHPQLLSAIRNGECTQQAALRLLAQPTMLALVESGQLPLSQAITQLTHGASPGEQELIEREEVTHGASLATPRRTSPEARSFRWRWVESARRELRRIQPAAVTPEERVALKQQLDDLQTLIEQIKAQCDMG